MKDINKYYQHVKQEIESYQLTCEEGAILEQVFTKYAVECLCDAGETENFDIAYEERYLGTLNQLKINGYSISANYETVDLFISIYKSQPNVCTTSKDEVLRAAKRITNFFRVCIYNEYADNIAESSEIFEFANSLGSFPDLRNNLIRVNVFILTNGTYRGEFPEFKEIAGYKLFYRVIDIEYLRQISQNHNMSIEIDLEEVGIKAPCLKVSTSSNATYETYIAVLTGKCLYILYEKYGSRLLENNVRSFLQFSGKINKGIKDTILNKPDMFMAYNNGISATADHIELDDSNRYIKKICNLQIVNGGQTTASIYHAYRDVKDKSKKPDLSKIYVQAKLSIIREKDKYSEIVSNISKFSNTQNKVNQADFSSNNHILIKIEQLSRSVLTPITEISRIQTYWYFERVRGQYKTAKRKEGFTKSRENNFLLKYPVKQTFSKEYLAKYLNAYGEVYDGKKLVIGPYSVAKGGQTNFNLFINYNLPSEKVVDSIFYEDVIAKAILFISADALYGTKRSKRAPIGDLKNATVPYTITLLTHMLEMRKRELDLFKIWQNQCISDNLQVFLYSLMQQVNERIISVVYPSTNYTEMAKKESTWIAVRDYNDWKCDISDIEQDLVNPLNPPKRISKNIDIAGCERDSELVRSIPWVLWNKIAEWGRESGYLDIDQQLNAKNIARNLKFNHELKIREIQAGLRIFNIVFEENYELLEQSDNIQMNESKKLNDPVLDNNACNMDITVDLVKQMIEWDRKNKKLQDWKFKIMQDVANGSRPLTPNLKNGFKKNLQYLLRYGFKPISDDQE